MLTALEGATVTHTNHGRPYGKLCHACQTHTAGLGRTNIRQQTRHQIEDRITLKSLRVIVQMTLELREAPSRRHYLALSVVHG